MVAAGIVERVAQADLAAAAEEPVVTDAAPEWCCGGKNRLIGGYSGCTPDHLPENREELPKKLVAIPASFAARMARSNLLMRLLLT